MFTVDKRIALEWLEHLQKETDRFIYELNGQTDVSVSVFASRVSLNHLRAMAQLADDGTNEAHIVEHAAHGMAHALVQGLPWTDPPAVHPPGGVAVN